jgi:hypothetical protein
MERIQGPCRGMENTSGWRSYAFSV